MYTDFIIADQSSTEDPVSVPPTLPVSFPSSKLSGYIYAVSFGLPRMDHIFAWYCVAYSLEYQAAS